MHTFSVSQFLLVLNESLAAIAPAGSFEVEGEVSSFGISQNKWVRFDLKDADGLINCFMSKWRLSEQITDGMKIAVTGYAKVYQKYGKLSLTVESVRLSGEGSLKRAFELLQKKLSSEGLFDAARKRRLPAFPEYIILVTSQDAAAYTDILRVARSRWPLARITLCNTSVQGADAPAHIVRALAEAQSLKPDVIILTRGGGSLEDLHPFNTEEVARAIFASTIPVVSAVGHERDVTIADLVADVRAATPSNAAEMVCPDALAVAADLQHITRQLENAMSTHGTRASQRIASCTASIDRWFAVLRERALRLIMRVTARDQQLQRDTEHWRLRINDTISHLRALHPNAILRRGFSYTTNKEGRIISRAAQLTVGAEVIQVYSDGRAHTRIERL